MFYKFSRRRKCEDSQNVHIAYQSILYFVTVPNWNNCSSRHGTKAARVGVELANSSTYQLRRIYRLFVNYKITAMNIPTRPWEKNIF